MKKYIISFLCAFSIISCTQSDKLGHKKLDLETFDFSKKMDDYFANDKFLQKDTLELDYDSTKIVDTYMTLGDSLTYMGNNFFNGTIVMQNSEHELMALKTSFKHTNTPRLENLMVYLVKKYGTPQLVRRKSMDSEYTSCYWQLNDRMIIVNSSFDSPFYKANLNKDLKNTGSYSTQLYIVNKAFQKELIGKTHGGEWMDLDDPEKQ